jgi:TP901 family phage tail tape measure protein
MNPGEAGTAYRAFLGKIGTGLEKIGLSSVDANNKLKSMPAILEEIKNKYGSSIDTQKEMPQLISAFGEEGVKAILNLLPHTKALANDIKELGSAADSLDFSAMKEMSNQNLSSYSSQLDRLDSGWKALKISLGSALSEGVFKNIVSGLADFVGWTLNLVESSPLVKEFFGYFLVGVSVIAGVVGIMATLTGATLMYTAFTQSAAAIQAGLATKFSPIDAAAGLTALANAGVQGAYAINLVLLPALVLAAASAGKCI